LVVSFQPIQHNLWWWWYWWWYFDDAVMQCKSDYHASHW
jgi:hypothetical protein